MNKNTSFNLYEDFRVQGRTTHKMEHIIYITIAAVLSGMESWNEIEMFGKEKFYLLKELLPDLKSIPSHDTFNRFFSLFKPEGFEYMFRCWVKDVVKDISGVVAIDGKLMRGPSKCDAEHTLGRDDFRQWIISAWSADSDISLGQVKVEDKSNEIKAVPTLLSCLDLKDLIITIDAMGCQTDITNKIVEGKGDYLIALKGNQKTSYELAKQLISDNKDREIVNIVTKCHSEEKKHGRFEERTCIAVSYGNTTEPMFKNKFKGLKTIVGIISKRTIIATGKTTEETRYYITSLDNKDPERLASIVRQHWSIENNLHWQLDVTFKEDESRKVKNAARNFSTITKIALSLLKRDKTVKGSMNLKRKKAALSDEYLKSLLNSFVI